MHKAVKIFCEEVKRKYPFYFSESDVLDVGSLDINGNNRFLFNNCLYTGLDIGPGPNVDVVCPVHLFRPGKQYDVIISSEMLEHDNKFNLSLQHMFNLLKDGGLLIITAAGFGRKEHGTAKSSPTSSPFTNDYYHNLAAEDIISNLPPQNFNRWELSYVPFDIHFWGIKN